MKESCLLNTKQLSVVLGVSRVTIHAWIKAGMPIACKDDSGCGSPKNLFDWLEVNAWIDEYKRS